MGHPVGTGERGLLLYNGGTVCDDNFSENSADAICREMGYLRALSWVSRSSYSYGTSQTSLDINLDDVRCKNNDWDSCTYSTSHDCVHNEDVFLTCAEGKFISSTPIVEDIVPSFDGMAPPLKTFL